MDKRALEQEARRYLASSADNLIPRDKALSAELARVPIFEEPLVAVGSATDPLFADMKREDAVGAHFMAPREWLPEAASVVSFFFPFTSAIRESNRRDMRYPSEGWLNGRIEGQAFLNKFAAAMVSFLECAGWRAVVPQLDPRFLSENFSSNWSERHVAYVCGMGTFSLSRGIITEKGMAGRLASVVTALPMDPDPRPYSGLYDYCSMCGKCVQNCPVKAISLEHGKDHQKCSDFLDAVRADRNPWYGCGKCQVSVPCEERRAKG